MDLYIPHIALSTAINQTYISFLNSKQAADINSKAEHPHTQ